MTDHIYYSCVEVLGIDPGPRVLGSVYCILDDIPRPASIKGWEMAWSGRGP